MSYHIIVATHYHERRVPCNETGRYHRHKTHVEQYTTALCGREVTKGKDGFCNLSIANPVEWPRNWCRSCIEAVSWKPEYVDKLKAKGLLRDEAGTP